MLKNLTRLEAQVAGKVYHLLCDQDSPIEHVKIALFEFVKYIGSIEDAANAAQQKTQEVSKSDPFQEEPKVENVN